MRKKANLANNNIYICEKWPVRYEMLPFAGNFLSWVYTETNY